MDTIERLEREGKIFVIRPSIECPGRTEIDRRKLQTFYNHGYKTMVTDYERMKEFLGI